MLSIARLVSLCLLSIIFYGNAHAQEAEIPPSVFLDQTILNNKAAFSTYNSRPESFLAAIFNYNSAASEDARFGDLREYILGLPDRKKNLDGQYDLIFSENLVQAWRDAEKKQVELDCDGQYLKDEFCGLSFDPLMCAQDMSDTGYYYRTEFETENMAVVSHTWPIDDPDKQKALAAYIMIKKQEGWVLDGVNCLNSVRFNWPK